MAISQFLNLKQTQSLVMTPQLQQAIKLLQMSNIELAEFLEEELAQNPLLEKTTPEGEESFDQMLVDPSAHEAEVNAYQKSNQDSYEQGQSESFDREGPLDTDYDNYWEGGSASGDLQNWEGSGGRSDFSDEEFGLEQMLAETKSLRDHLMEQVTVDLQNPEDRIIGTYLIDMLDDAGYFVGDVRDVAQKLETAPERVEMTLLRMQQFDPPGIFARDLQECLMLQLKDRNRWDPMMKILVQNLDDLAKGNSAKLQKLCKVSEEDLAGMIRDIKALDPKPADAFREQIMQPVVPDVLMRPKKSGGWVVELNSQTLPRVLVNEQYYADVSADIKKKEDKDYLHDRMQAANWLVKAMHQRATTILKVSQAIVQQQEAFFLYGVQYLKPLVLKDIAEMIDMHESTVSRVTTNKYMSTPRGLFELKYFFTSSIAASGTGAAHSAESVRHRIKALVAEESATKPLSDDQLVKILQDEGMDIARRTVAKYREQLGLGSSTERRRAHKLRQISSK